MPKGITGPKIAAPIQAKAYHSAEPPAFTKEGKCPACGKAPLLADLDHEQSGLPARGFVCSANCGWSWSRSPQRTSPKPKIRKSLDDHARELVAELYGIKGTSRETEATEIAATVLQHIYEQGFYDYDTHTEPRPIEDDARQAVKRATKRAAAKKSAESLFEQDASGLLQDILDQNQPGAEKRLAAHLAEAWDDGFKTGVDSVGGFDRPPKSAPVAEELEAQDHRSLVAQIGQLAAERAAVMNQANVWRANLHRLQQAEQPPDDVDALYTNSVHALESLALVAESIDRQLAMLRGDLLQRYGATLTADEIVPPCRPTTLHRPPTGPRGVQ